MYDNVVNSVSFSKVFFQFTAQIEIQLNCLLITLKVYLYKITLIAFETMAIRYFLLKVFYRKQTIYYC